MAKGYDWELEENDGNYVSIKKFCSEHKFLSEAALRWRIHLRDHPIQEAIVRLGSKILIDKNKFFELLHEGKLATNIQGKRRKKKEEDE